MKRNDLFYEVLYFFMIFQKTHIEKINLRHAQNIKIKRYIKTVIKKTERRNFSGSLSFPHVNPFP